MRPWGRLLGIALLAVIALTACSASDDVVSSEARTDGTPGQELTPGEPYPYDRPAPPRAPTPIDGTYARTITIRQAGGRPVYCRRCAPYRRDAGRSRVIFEEGRFFIRYRPVPPKDLCSDCLRPPDFTATGHYRVSGDRLVLFNDPNCTHTTGVYTWSLNRGRLTLQVEEDPCPYVRLRAKFLTATVWRAS
jgi:hypothetical protein